MIYLLYGTEDILITDEINKVVLENNIDEFNISRYNLEESLLKNIIEDCQTMTLFNDKKMVIVDNSYIFVRTQKKYLEQDIDVLIEYSNNPNPNTILIFSLFLSEFFILIIFITYIIICIIHIFFYFCLFSFF